MFLTVHRPLQITHIVVCLYGYVKVYRNGSLSGDNVYKEGAYLGTGRGKRGTEYFGNGFASIFEDELILCGDGRLLPGKYAFKYELEFPSQGLPSSIDVSVMRRRYFWLSSIDTAAVRTGYRILHDNIDHDKTSHNRPSDDL